MKTINRITLVLLSLSVGACTSHGEHGQGGMAEHYISGEFTPVMPDEPLGPEHGLRFDWHLSQLHLDMLVQEGAKWCFPASVVQITMRQNRIARELESKMFLDAANDIIIQRKAINKLDQRLTYVTNTASCVPPNQGSHGGDLLLVIQQLVDLLNIDNQFAYNSSEVNPKYMGRLAEAAQILKQYPELTLTITGHADADGALQYNEKLALDRAEQVERYLTIFGINPERITTRSLGERVPLYEGQTKGVKLANRRVTIEVHSVLLGG